VSGLVVGPRPRLCGRINNPEPALIFLRPMYGQSSSPIKAACQQEHQGQYALTLAGANLSPICLILPIPVGLRVGRLVGATVGDAVASVMLDHPSDTYELATTLVVAVRASPLTTREE
jgi:hypothetical protein